MAIDKSKYIGQFVDEGFENIAVVEALLFEIKEGGSIEDDLVTLLRALHTLKGSARMLEFKRIETLSHALESVFVALKEQRIDLTDAAVRLTLAGLDELKTGLETVRNTKTDGIETAPFEKELAALAANEEFTVLKTSRAAEAAVTSTTQADSAEQSSGEAEADSGAAPALSAATESEAKGAEASPPSSSPTDQKNAKRNKLEEAKTESIRIPLEKINEIIRNMASLQSLEISAKNISRDTETANEACRQLSRLLAQSSALNSPLVREFRLLEQMVSKITSRLKNYSIDVGNHTKGAYDSVIGLRMLPLSTILDTYPRAVFTIASELGKKVQLRIEGAENEIDKNIIESLSDVFLHMVRNSIDHGIEAPAERVKAGKDETGILHIRCVRESGNMKITVSDDGGGINIEAIRRKVVKQGLVTKENAPSLTEEDLMNYIFRSGFSTSETISNVSGRGVGMDAVRNNIERMKGSIIVESEAGKGTTFTISVPLSMASLMGFPIVSGTMKFIIPANFVDTVLLIDKEDIITVVDRPGIKYDNRIIKLYYLNQVLRIPDGNKGPAEDAIFVVIIRAYEETIALGIDSVSSMRSVILKSMPSVLETMPVFSGVVLSEDYEMIPALHIPTLIRMARRTKTIDMKKRHIEYERLRKSILVVDDSRPTRDIERDILQAEGYKVDTAANGSEALAAAKNTRYDLICTDINMPVMDGFMLTENIRKNDSLKSIPVIVISSKTDDDDQARSAMLGANRFIVKNSFNNHNLISAIKELIGAANG
ncbi:hybrid sensor histidine kinase/response regulator [Spirochaetia bacterium]|nr:hybrid sensor histidine kinase/response regulator [Spirochaetia bacterium]